jgi:hypothetical protein
MQFRSRTLVSALLLQACFVALQAAAGPVVQDDAGLSAKPLKLRIDPAADDGPGLGAPLPAEAPASDASRADGAPAGQQQSPSASGAQVTHPQRPSEARPAAKPAAARARPALQAASAGGEPDAGIDTDLQEAAKAALQWAHEARDAVLPAQQDGLAAESAAASAPNPARVQPAPVSPLIVEPEVGTTSPQFTAAGRPIGKLNLVQEAIELVKTIAGHPFTWLVVLLAVFGSAAAGVVRYRAYAQRRRSRRRAGMRRGKSLDPARGRRHVTPTATEGSPRRVRSPKEAVPVRPGMRRTSKSRRTL